MKKSNLSAVIILCIITSLVSGCFLFGGAVKQSVKEHYAYNNERPLFVGVYEGLNNAEGRTYFTGFDVLRNEYQATMYFMAKNFGIQNVTVRCSVTITAEKNADNTTAVLVTASKPEIEDLKTGAFRTTQLDLVSIENKAAKNITDIMKLSDEAFENRLNKTISNLDFLHSVCYGMNSVAFKRWIEAINLSNRILSIQYMMHNMEEGLSKEYKYRITGSYTPESKFFTSSTMYITFDTNNDEYIKYRKGEMVSVKGKIKSIEQSTFSIDSYTIRMED
ncbi:hypothetical protein [Treponema sp. OMZ 855]|uniref:hypothetical protein n=1 Tax=Treponema sp. OMZ 855 TaxID=1643512 RepID=UPI0020A2D92E|nr:hypothetical protein [Treponema sp. OMZ 855]UTC49847.1 hypothetical protein E4N65_06940 [Treponema sp. OMZ 855]